MDKSPYTWIQKYINDIGKIEINMAHEYKKLISSLEGRSGWYVKKKLEEIYQDELTHITIYKEMIALLEKAKHLSH